MDAEENQKQVFPLSHLFSLLEPNQERNPAANRFTPVSRLILQLENACIGTKQDRQQANPHEGTKTMGGVSYFGAT
jgi:hypothetical protein